MVNVDTMAEALITSEVATGLLTEWMWAASDFPRYTFEQGISRPRGTTQVQWREETLDTLLADALVRLERAVTLLGGTT